VDSVVSRRVFLVFFPVVLVVAVWLVGIEVKKKKKIGDGEV